MFIPEVIPIAQWRGLSTWLKINLFTPHLILYLPGEADHNFFLAVPHSTSDEPILHGQYWMLHWALNRTVIQSCFFYPSSIWKQILVTQLSLKPDSRHAFPSVVVHEVLQLLFFSQNME